MMKRQPQTLKIQPHYQRQPQEGINVQSQPNVGIQIQPSVGVQIQPSSGVQIQPQVRPESVDQNKPQDQPLNKGLSQSQSLNGQSLDPSPEMQPQIGENANLKSSLQLPVSLKLTCKSSLQKVVPSFNLKESRLQLQLKIKVAFKRSL